MTPQQKIIWALIIQVSDWAKVPVPDSINADTVDEIYDSMMEEHEDLFQDARSEMREGDVETNLPCDWSRHYESKSVAAKMPDDSWVGWTYWYGGGKHGEPEAIDWIDDAYDVECKEEEKLMVVRTFTKPEPATA